jgi:hypothetical protein
MWSGQQIYEDCCVDLHYIALDDILICSPIHWWYFGRVRSWWRLLRLLQFREHHWSHPWTRVCLPHMHAICSFSHWMTGRMSTAQRQRASTWPMPRVTPSSCAQMTPQFWRSMTRGGIRSGFGPINGTTSMLSCKWFLVDASWTDALTMTVLTYSTCQKDVGELLLVIRGFCRLHILK